MSMAARRRDLLTGGFVAAATAVLQSSATQETTIVSAERDADLIALCARFIEADMLHEALCDQQEEIGSDDPEWERLDNLVTAEGVILFTLEPQIAALPATSPAGLRAKMTATCRLFRKASDQRGGVLIRSLLVDLLPEGRA